MNKAGFFEKLQLLISDCIECNFRVHYQVIPLLSIKLTALN
jgi:hypothetical protein